ncbi:hypothetical protein Ciccas_011164 [Cichlidogyrus casuarinus]|uniref:Uncharacterized protein n=1 Tax=Cichlidogyrus casuarinus TaxID=1844966 RepID=A0ABD2PT70_9PLAT
MDETAVFDSSLSASSASSVGDISVSDVTPFSSSSTSLMQVYFIAVPETSNRTKCTLCEAGNFCPDPATKNAKFSALSAPKSSKINDNSDKKKRHLKRYHHKEFLLFSQVDKRLLGAPLLTSAA